MSTDPKELRDFTHEIDAMKGLIHYV
jgi:hypothetical protein